MIILLRKIRSLFYNIICACIKIQAQIFGISNEVWGYRVLNGLISISSIFLVWLCSRFLGLNIYLSIFFGILPFIGLILFLVKDKPNGINNATIEFEKLSILHKSVYYFLLFGLFLLLPILLISFLLIK